MIRGHTELSRGMRMNQRKIIVYQFIARRINDSYLRDDGAI